MYFSASRPKSFTASLGSTETSSRATILAILVVDGLHNDGLVLLVVLDVGANASTPDARRKRAVAVLIRRDIMVVERTLGECERRSGWSMTTAIILS